MRQSYIKLCQLLLCGIFLHSIPTHSQVIISVDRAEYSPGGTGTWYKYYFSVTGDYDDCTKKVNDSNYADSIGVNHGATIPQYWSFNTNSALHPGDTICDAIQRFYAKNGNPALGWILSPVSPTDPKLPLCFNYFNRDIPVNRIDGIQCVNATEIKPPKPETSCNFVIDRFNYEFTARPGLANGESKTQDMIISCTGPASVRIRTQYEVVSEYLVAALSIRGTSLLDSVTIKNNGGGTIVPLTVSLKGYATTGVHSGSTVVFLDVD